MSRKHLFRKKKECQSLIIREIVFLAKNIFSAKIRETEIRSVIIEIVISTEDDFNKLEPEVIRMLMRLIVTTDIIRALILLS